MLAIPPFCAQPAFETFIRDKTRPGMALPGMYLNARAGFTMGHADGDSRSPEVAVQSVVRRIGSPADKHVPERQTPRVLAEARGHTVSGVQQEVADSRPTDCANRWVRREAASLKSDFPDPVRDLRRVCRSALVSARLEDSDAIFLLTTVSAEAPREAKRRAAQAQRNSASIVTGHQGESHLGVTLASITSPSRLRIRTKTLPPREELFVHMRYVNGLQLTTTGSVNGQSCAAHTEAAISRACCLEVTFLIAASLAINEFIRSVNPASEQDPFEKQAAWRDAISVD